MFYFLPISSKGENSRSGGKNARLALKFHGHESEPKLRLEAQFGIQANASEPNALTYGIGAWWKSIKKGTKKGQTLDGEA